MTRNAKWIPLLILFVMVPVRGLRASTPRNLAESFKASVEKTETVGIDAELINQAEEKYRQSLAAILPQVSAVGSLLQQQTPSSASGAAISPGSEPLAKLTATQVLFQGGALPGLKELKKLREASQQNEQFARLTLFTTVAANFYGIVSLEQIMNDYASEVASYKDWIKALRQRISIGRSQLTEVLMVEATMSSLLAQIELARGQLNAARELYTYITGLPQDTPLVDDRPLDHDLNGLEYYINGVEKRPDVRSNVLTRDANDEAISVAKLGRLPTVGLTADYYLHRYGVTEDVKWDAMFLLTIPLYTGGTIDSQVRTAISQSHQQELTLSQTRRQAEETIRAAYQTAVADKAQLEALRRAKKANDLNVKAEIHDYKLGLVTNLDVLNALVSYQQSEIALDQGIFTNKLDFDNLETQAGINSLISPPADVTTSGSPLSFPVF